MSIVQSFGFWLTISASNGALNLQRHFSSFAVNGEPDGFPSRIGNPVFDMLGDCYIVALLKLNYFIPFKF